VRALILYESLFGNTNAVAEAVADGVRAARPDAAVNCRRVDDPVAPDEFDLVVLGAPTHFWGLTGPLSRSMESQYERRLMGVGAAEPGAVNRRATATTGMRTRLATLPPGRGRAAAAFDTCMTGPLTGGARGAIAHKLERAGYRLLAEPETFLVEAVAGPLMTGEVERARAWGAALAHALSEQDTSNWRKTMERHDADVLTTPDGATFDGAQLAAPPAAARTAPLAPKDAASRPLDVTRIVTTTEVVLGAVLVARYLARRPGSTKAVVSMGPGGWVSMKGGTVAVRRGSRPWARPTPVRRTATGERVPLWARVLSAVPLQALMR
jgi:multimeric flavodoxin WrbA